MGFQGSAFSKRYKSGSAFDQEILSGGLTFDLMDNLTDYWRVTALHLQ